MDEEAARILAVGHNQLPADWLNNHIQTWKNSEIALLHATDRLWTTLERGLSPADVEALQTALASPELFELLEQTREHSILIQRLYESQRISAAIPEAWGVLVSRAVQERLIHQLDLADATAGDGAVARLQQKIEQLRKVHRYLSVDEQKKVQKQYDAEVGGLSQEIEHIHRERKPVMAFFRIPSNELKTRILEPLTASVGVDAANTVWTSFVAEVEQRMDALLEEKDEWHIQRLTEDIGRGFSWRKDLPLYASIWRSARLEKAPRPELSRRKVDETDSAWYSSYDSGGDYGGGGGSD